MSPLCCWFLLYNQALILPIKRCRIFEIQFSKLSKLLYLEGPCKWDSHLWMKTLCRVFSVFSSRFSSHQSHKISKLAFQLCFIFLRKEEARWKLSNQFIPQFISSQIKYLVKTGSSQYFFSSPKTSLRFLPHPREKPFLSGPFRNVGARNVSVKEKHATYFKAPSSQGK